MSDEQKREIKQLLEQLKNDDNILNQLIEIEKSLSEQIEYIDYSDVELPA